MVSVLDREQVKPSPTLVSRLVRIGELKQLLNTLEQEACEALGLRVQVMSLESQPDATTGSKDSIDKRIDGFQRLRVMAGSAICMQAWKEPKELADWTILFYEPGHWEMLCQPTLRLVQWMYEWGGVHTDMQLTLQIAIDDFKRTGELLLPLRNETRGRLCGRCGEEVQELEAHIQALHNGVGSPLPLDLHVMAKDGRKSVRIARGQGGHQQIWSIHEQLHSVGLNDHGYRLGLPNEIKGISSMIGKCRLSPRNRKYTLPDDITPFPFLAHVLRTLTL